MRLPTAGFQAWQKERSDCSLALNRRAEGPTLERANRRAPRGCLHASIDHHPRRYFIMSSGLGIPVKLLHESLGHIITVELKTGQLYRGKLAEGA